MSTGATSIGIVASRALRPGARGIVRSVFERSFYVAFGKAWICIGPPGLGEGPLNLLCAPPGPRLRGDERKGAPFDSIGQRLCEGDPASVRDGVLRIGDGLIIDLAGATVWSPSARRRWDRARLAHGLAAFEAALPKALPGEGLALLLRPPPDEALPAVARAARAPAEALASLARSATAADGPHTPLTAAQAGIQVPPIETTADSALGLLVRGDEPMEDGKVVARLQSLLGLGPGLTPSGDDFLAGAMVALTCLGMIPLRDAMWASLAPLAATHTNEISLAHLAAAAEGFGSAALHALLDAVITGNTEHMPMRLATVAAVGHTSGWDAMAGALTVMRSTRNPEQ